MRDILLTGNLKVVTDSFLQQLNKEQRVILCGDLGEKEFHQKRVVSYNYREDDNEYRGIFQSYDLDTVIFLSRVTDGQKKIYDEIERLENALFCSGFAKVRKFIYVTTNDYTEDGESARTRLLRTCEELCRKFSDDYNTDVFVLRVPYLFSVEDTESALAKMVKSAFFDNKLILAGDKDEKTDFLSAADLAELLSRVVDEPVRGYHRVDVGGGNVMTFEKLADVILSWSGESTVTYCGYREAVPKALNDGNVRHIYGWFPVEALEDVILDLAAACRKKQSEAKKKKSHSTRMDRMQRLILASVEMAVLFVVSEFLTIWAAPAQIDYVDFRLLFVVIMGTVHGTKAGITASLLASTGYFARDIVNSNLQIIFFNIENWLPFAGYFLSGTIVGHIRDKNRESIRSLEEQQKILEQKYVFLNELYGKTLEKKDDFSRQIMGYQDSFGKIYQVVKRLNSAVTDRIFFEAVNSMEEMLEVTSVAIYTINGENPFARLNVCSREINAELSKSLDMSQYEPLWETLKEKQNWVNTAGIKNFPSYAAPIIRKDNLIGMIFLWHGHAGQMKTEYYNKFNIICGLVQDALIRAIEYSEYEEQRRMIPGTRFMKPEYFEQMLTAKQQLDKNGMSNYVLLQIQSDNEEGEISEVVSSGIRNTDILGKRLDGRLYLLLNQADSKSVQLVKKRLEPKGIRLMAC